MLKSFGSFEWVAGNEAEWIAIELLHWLIILVRSWFKLLIDAVIAWLPEVEGGMNENGMNQSGRWQIQ